MFKKSISLLLMLCLILSATSLVFANVSNHFYTSDLRYQNGEVICEGQIAEFGCDIDLTMKLYRNGRTIRTWNATGYNLVQMEETYPAVSGSTYQLSFVCYVDGNPVTIPTRTLVCP